jgi:FemAB-related protein (PEP-CTERM system-associated)
MEITEFGTEGREEWNAYVHQHSGASFYHMYGWRNVIEQAYGHRPYYLVAREQGTITGILPLFIMKSIILGRKMISLPFGSYGGICADDTETEKALLDAATKRTRELNLDYLELRCRSNHDHGLICDQTYNTMILELDEDSDVVWKNRFNKKVRNATRKAMKSGLTVEQGNGYLKEFYELYAKSMAMLGTPVHSFRFFELVLSEFPENTGIFVSKKDEKVLAALVMLNFRNHFISGWEASDRDSLDLNPNNILYWESIRFACEHGFRFFDFGRSVQDSGTYRFKKPWGAESHQLYYQYFLNRKKSVPNSSTKNESRTRFSNNWKKLPFPITRIIGPMLRRSLP